MKLDRCIWTFFVTWLLFAVAGSLASTTLTVGELEPAGTTSGSVPVGFRSDSAVAAVQMDVLFDPALYVTTSATSTLLTAPFRVDSHLAEPGRLKVLVGAPNNAALPDGIVFRIPISAVDAFSSLYPIVLTDFALSTSSGTPVVGKIAPRIRLLGLSDGGRVNGTSGVVLSVEAGAADGTVARVEFYTGNQKIGESTGTPFTISWTPPGSGPFTIRAVAYDSNGLVTESRSISVVVTNVGTAALKGLYAGLVTRDPFAFGTNGFIQFSTTPKGSFTVKVLLNGKSHSSIAKFATDGTATVVFKRSRSENPLTLTLQQYATNLVDQISGQLTDGTIAGSIIENATFIAEVTADRAVWKSGVREPMQQGLYTIVLPPAPDASNTPTGSGVGTARVSNTGMITSAMTLADGTKASQGTFLSKDAQWPLYASLYKSRGLLTGQMTFAEEVDISDFAGVVHWIRPSATKPGPYQAGFEATMDAVGSKYRVPLKFERVLNLANLAGNAAFIAEGADLPTPLQRLVTVNSMNIVTPLVSDGTKLRLQLKPATGAMSGSFVPPFSTKPIPFTGVVFPKQNLGTGHFIQDGLAGNVTINANPDFPISTPSQPQGINPLPMVTWKTPKDKGRIETGAILATGTAKSKTTVQEVLYQVLHDGILTAPQVAVGTNEWSIDFTPLSGNGGFYQFFVKARDVVSRTFFYVASTPLQVSVNGPGDVTKGFAGSTSRETGATYTITAKATRGHSFTGWTGSVTSSAPSITFTMRPGFAIEAHFQ